MRISDWSSDVCSSDLVLVPTVTDRIDADIVAAAGERLKLIANFGAGVDHIDLAAARARGIMVSNTPGVFTEDTADMTMALILSVPRRLAERSEEHTSELQSLMRISYAVCCLTNKNKDTNSPPADLH